MYLAETEHDESENQQARPVCLRLLIRTAQVIKLAKNNTSALDNRKLRIFRNTDGEIERRLQGVGQPRRQCAAARKNDAALNDIIRKVVAFLGEAVRDHRAHQVCNTIWQVLVRTRGLAHRNNSRKRNDRG